MNEWDKGFKALTSIIGTPEENRNIVLKAIFLEKNLLCSRCKIVFDRGATIAKYLKFKTKRESAGSLDLYLICVQCGHGGTISLNPNPFIVT